MEVQVQTIFQEVWCNTGMVVEDGMKQGQEWVFSVWRPECA